MANGIAERIEAVLAEFDGIAGARITVGGDRVVVALVFEDDVRGRAAALLTGHVFARMGNGPRLDGRAPVSADPSLAPARPLPDAEYFALTRQQAEILVRSLRYAIDVGFEAFGDVSTDVAYRDEPATDMPLFVLLSRAFETVCRSVAVEEEACLSVPSLGVWSNVLRPFDGDLAPGELSRRAVVSRRAIRALVRDLERLGWVEAFKSPRGRSLLRLTATGERAREAGGRLAQAAERDFAARFGSERTAALRRALTALVDQLEIELPWHLTGYGLADSSLTGGNHVPAQPGSPRVPAHGADWPAVVKDPDADASTEPLSALLSKSLATYRIDYEWEMRGHGTGLDFTANFLRLVGDDGIDFGTASALGGVTGNGRSALERHLVVVAEPRQGRGIDRRVYLTPKGRQARDAYPHLVAKVEREWQRRYGGCVGDLRKALVALDEAFDPGLPNFPSTTEWLRRSMLAGSAADRVRRVSTRDPSDHVESGD